MITDSHSEHLNLNTVAHTLKCITADVIKDFPEHERPGDYKSSFPIMDRLKKAIAEADVDTMLKLFDEVKN